MLDQLSENRYAIFRRRRSAQATLRVALDSIWRGPNWEETQLEGPNWRTPKGGAPQEKGPTRGGP